MCRATMLRRVDPELNVARLYRAVIQRDRFGAIRLVRTSGPARDARARVGPSIGGKEATDTLEALAEAKVMLGTKEQRVT